MTFQWDDPFLMSGQLHDDERMIWNTVHTFAQKELLPKIPAANRHETFDPSFLQKMGEQGVLDVATPSSENDQGLSYVSYGLTARALEGVDSSLRSSFSVQCSLVMYPISAYGSPEQKDKYLGPLKSGTMIGCFGLTEPGAGSDPSSLQTKAKRHKDGWILNGEKTWITHSPVADIFLVWARDDDGNMQGFLIDKGTPGLSAKAFEGKFSLRASSTGNIALQDVIVSDDQRLPGIKGFRSIFECLNRARYGIAWGTLGAAESCWFTARNYALERQQFGKPIAGFQLVQKKLVDMQIQISLGLQGALRMGRLMDQGECPVELISLMKRQGCEVALTAARTARDILGANGISDEYPIIRHLMNLEAVNTYEGTADMHTLILGKAMTGQDAFR